MYHWQETRDNLPPEDRSRRAPVILRQYTTQEGPARQYTTGPPAPDNVPLEQVRIDPMCTCTGLTAGTRKQLGRPGSNGASTGQYTTGGRLWTIYHQSLVCQTMYH